MGPHTRKTTARAVFDNGKNHGLSPDFNSRETAWSFRSSVSARCEELCEIDVSRRAALSSNATSSRAAKQGPPTWSCSRQGAAAEPRLGVSVVKRRQ